MSHRFGCEDAMEFCGYPSWEAYLARNDPEDEESPAKKLPTENWWDDQVKEVEDHDKQDDEEVEAPANS